MWCGVVVWCDMMNMMTFLEVVVRSKKGAQKLQRDHDLKITFFRV